MVRSGKSIHLVVPVQLDPGDLLDQGSWRVITDLDQPPRFTIKLPPGPTPIHVNLTGEPVRSIADRIAASNQSEFIELVDLSAVIDQGRLLEVAHLVDEPLVVYALGAHPGSEAVQVVEITSLGIE
jgi:hypothetical protein